MAAFIDDLAHLTGDLQRGRVITTPIALEETMALSRLRSLRVSAAWRSYEHPDNGALFGGMLGEPSQSAGWQHDDGLSTGRAGTRHAVSCATRRVPERCSVRSEQLCGQPEERKNADYVMVTK